MTKTFLIFFLSLTSLGANCQSPTVIDRVFILGNFADVEDVAMVEKELGKLISIQPTPYVILLDGDIVKTDLSDAAVYAKEKERLRTLQGITGKHPNGTILIVPGDRDWMDSGEKGLRNVQLLEKLVKSLDDGNIIFDPDDGCPGPKVKELGNSLSIISIGTQWFNHPHDRPRDTEVGCKYTNEVDYMEELDDAIDDTNGRNIIIAGHFPIVSNGIYGGRTPLAWHLVPVLGSFYASYRQNIGTHRDLTNKRYSPIREKMAKMLRDNEAVVYASGHESNLEVLQQGNNIFVNSGSLGHGGLVAKSANTLYRTSKRGLVEIRYLSNGDVRTVSHILKDGTLTEADNRQVMHGKCGETQTNIEIENSHYSGCLKTQVPPEPMAQTGQKVAVAGPQYGKKPGYTFFFGDRYRDSWTKQVTAPVLDLSNEHGGLTPYKHGGGRQTTSLKFEAGDGRKYTFRSVDKDFKPVIPFELRGTGVARIVQDQTSAQQPYGAMPTDVMLNELGDIPHAHPVLFIMPDDPALGVWQDEFAGMLGMLEEDPKDWANDTLPGFYGADDVEKSYELFHHLYKDPYNRVDQPMLATARAFDVFVGDWGKHQDNWKWAEYKTDKGSIYRPIPRDRDHVFSKWDGVFPYLVSREWAIGTFGRFTGKIENVEELDWPARELDRSLLNAMDRKDWHLAAQYVKNAMTDEVIHEAMLSMPAEVYDKDGKEIEERLKSRRELLPRRIDDYYLFLAKEVDVIGSNRRDYFEVVRMEDGSVQVSIFDVDSEGRKDSDERFYHRVFLRSETEEIHLYGLGGNDIVDISGEGGRSILVRVVPGPGKDAVTDRSTARGICKKTLVYEKSDKAELKLGTEAKEKKPWNDNLYYYNRDEYKYDRYLPIPVLSYNQDDGFGIGLGVSLTRNKWGKENYQSMHTVSGSITSQGFFRLNLVNRFHHVIHKWDVLLNSSYQRTGYVHYFYGFGPNTIFDQDLYDNDFYQVRRIALNVESGLSRQFAKQSEFSLLARYEDSEDGQEKENILESVNVTGENPYRTAEAQAVLDLDFRDSQIFPKRGARLYGSYLFGNRLNSDSLPSQDQYHVFTGSMEFYTSTRNRIFPVTFGIKGGYEQASEFTPFYKMPAVGITDHLKGYRRNRFSSDRLSYLNGEIRIKLFNIPKAFVPLEFGITSFYDIAKVNPTADLGGGDENFTSYGGGIYIVPWTRSFTLSLSAGFSEENQGLIVFGLGTLLNKGNP